MFLLVGKISNQGPGTNAGHVQSWAKSILVIFLQPSNDAEEFRVACLWFNSLLIVRQICGFT
jgi:hypothetical protein